MFNLIAIYLHSQFDGELHVDGFGLLATTKKNAKHGTLAAFLQQTKSIPIIKLLLTDA